MKTQLKDISSFVNVLTYQKLTEIIVTNFIKRRKELKYSQQKLATLSGVSYGSIKRFEQKGEISFQSLLKIADAINALDDFKNIFSTPLIKDLKDEW